MNTDLIAILGNISQNLFPVQKLITGGAYILGIVLVVSALAKFKERGQSSSMTVPLFYLVFGIGLLYIPTSIIFLENTVFGAGNILSYSSTYNKADIYSSMDVIIRTAGLIWFVRGSILICQASQPGTQEGPKGFLFLFAGILAMNFSVTLGAMNWIITHLLSWSLSLKQG
jgi:hypothetical protein